MNRRKLISIFCMFITCLSTITLFSQAPEGIIYQAEARTQYGNLIRLAYLDVKITILSGAPDGTVVWEGDHEVRTDAYGQFTLVIGEGTGGIYDFSAIPWATDTHFLNVKITDRLGRWLDMGTTQFLSVPYALHANSASSVEGISYLDLPDVPTNLSDFYNDVGFALQAEVYSKSDMQTAGNSQVHWDNITDEPLLFSGSWNDLQDKPTSFAGFGLPDAATYTYVDARIAELQAVIDALVGSHTLCGGVLVDLQSDESNCGECENECNLGFTCVNGECVLVCPGNQIEIDGQCIDPNTDDRYCGATSTSDPGVDCSATGRICVNGVCVLNCPIGLIECNGQCIDISSDVNNCGACGANCPDGSVCVDGTCVELILPLGSVCEDGSECQSGFCVEYLGIPICSECAIDGDCPAGYECVYDHLLEYFICVETVSSACIDSDGDGYGQGTDCLGPDCDDQDETVHPGAVEICGDGVDNDCDITTDDVCENSEYWVLETPVQIICSPDGGPIVARCNMEGFTVSENPSGTMIILDLGDYGIHQLSTIPSYWEVDDNGCLVSFNFSGQFDGNQFTGTLDVDFELSCGCQSRSIALSATRAISPGDLLITEMMIDPEGADAEAEWFEIYNSSSSSIDMEGLVINIGDSNNDVETFMVGGLGFPILLGPNEYFVCAFGSNTPNTDNVFPTTNPELSNLGGSISLLSNDTEIVSVSYSTDWVSTGYSIQLKPENFNLSDIQDFQSWSFSSSEYSTGNYGTPGTANEP